MLFTTLSDILSHHELEKAKDAYRAQQFATNTLPSSPFT